MMAPKHDTNEPNAASDADYLLPYRAMIQKHGASFEATGWKNRDMQITRFDVMLPMVDFTGRIVVDAGSGLGGLAEHLSTRGIEYGRYIGLDAMKKMVEQSRAKKLAEAEFVVCDFASDVDAFSRFTKEAGGKGIEVVVFSGSLNTMRQDEAIGVLERAWEAASEAVVFNFLSNRARADMLSLDPTPAHRFDTMRLVDWALNKTPAVRFRQDYFVGHDATIAMFKAR